MERRRTRVTKKVIILGGLGAGIAAGTASVLGWSNLGTFVAIAVGVLVGQGIGYAIDANRR